MRLLAVLEIGLGSVAATVPGHLSAAGIAGAYAGFSVYILRAGMAPRLRGDCGCFGAASAPPGILHVALNALACAVGVLAAVVPPQGLTWIFTRSAAISIALVAGICAATYAAYLLYTVVPVLWAAYGSGDTA